MGITNETIGTNPLYIAYSRFGTLRQPYLQENTYAYVRRELGRGFTQTVGLQSRSFVPQFAYAYRLPNDTDSHLRSTYRTTELNLETRFAPGELMVQNGNERYGIAKTNQLVMRFQYNIGIQGRCYLSPSATRAYFGWAMRTTRCNRLSSSLTATPG